MGLVTSIEALKEAISRTLRGEIYLANRLSKRDVVKVSSTDKTGNMYGLSKREIDVLRELSRGKINKEIATGLNISIRTVEKHRSNLRSKTATYSTSKLNAIASQMGLC